MRRASLRALASAGLLLALPGCGDTRLWARWRAERASWHAQRLAAPVVHDGLRAGEARAARAQSALEGMLRAFPPGEWEPLAGRDTLSREVGRLAGEALVTLGRLEAARGDTAGGLRRLESAERLRALPSVCAAATEARARLLGSAGRDIAAAAAWESLAGRSALDSAVPGEVLPPVLAAPVRAARMLQALGRAAERDSLLARADRRWSAEISGARPGAPRTALLEALAELRHERGDLDGARDALRRALADPMGPDGRHSVLLRVAALALEAGRPDTSRAYAGWAAATSGGLARAAALQARAMAWEVSGPPDSALEAWGGLLAEYRRAQDFAAEARFHRGVVLEGSDRWVQARSEYRALIATQPAHPRAFAASLRIVEHHLAAGENDLAELEARHAREQMDQLIATQHDAQVQRAARRTRAALDSLMGEQGSAGAGRSPAPGD